MAKTSEKMWTVVSMPNWDETCECLSQLWNEYSDNERDLFMIYVKEKLLPNLSYDEFIEYFNNCGHRYCHMIKTMKIIGGIDGLEKLMYNLYCEYKSI